MTSIYNSGIRLVLLLQTLGWLEGPMRFFTFLGTADFFILVLPVVYWCIDSSLGVRIGFILLFSNSFNEVVKLALQGPRPYWISPQVQALSAESSFGVPSGHAQIAAGVWGTIAAHVHRHWAWIVAIAIIFLIGLSRIFLAVHFPHDVLVGWLLGGLTLWAFLAWWNPVAAWLKHRTFLQQVLLAAAASLVLVAIDGMLISALRGFVVPSSWISNAARAGEPYPDPLSMEGVLTSSGALLGLAVGLAWIEQRGGFRPSGSFWKRLLCFLIGLLGLLALYLGLSYIIPSDSSLIGSTFRFVRYAIVGAWISAGAPLVFFGLQLAERPDRTREASA